jgi:hypothetical protein
MQFWGEKERNKAMREDGLNREIESIFGAEVFRNLICQELWWLRRLHGG